MSGLTTHVLDLSHGRPAADVAIRLLSRSGVDWTSLLETQTDQDGRARLRDGDALTVGAYRLEFDIGVYFRTTGAAAADPGFLETVSIDFHVTDASAHYHVPLLASPFGYSTYRGS
jgi:5-hydroxyisourate hydrolase